MKRPTREAEDRLVKRLRRGDLEARAELIQTHLWMAVRMARRYVQSGTPLLELISDGNLGLLKAVDRFRCNGKCRFVTYAWWWVRNAIIQSLATRSLLVRIPRKQVDNVRRLLRARIRLEQVYGREATLDDVAIALGEVVDHLRIVCRWLRQPASLSETVVEGQGHPLTETLEDAASSIPGLCRGPVLSSETIDQLLRVLSPKQRRVLELRFGLRAGEPQTLEVIGRGMGVTHEAIRQIEARALRRIRHPGRLNWLREQLERDRACR